MNDKELLMYEVLLKIASMKDDTYFELNVLNMVNEVLKQVESDD